MTNTPGRTPPAGDWRWPLTMGLAIGIGVPLARAMKLEQALGMSSSGAVAMNAAAAGVIGGVVALVVYGLLKRVGRTSA